MNRLAPGFDAVVIAAFSDPGLEEARAMSPVPIVGIAESAMLTALMCGGRFAIVTLGPALRPLLEMAAQKLRLRKSSDRHPYSRYRFRLRQRKGRPSPPS